MADPTVPPIYAVLLKAVQRMLRPSVRLMLRYGKTFPVMTDLLRVLYVDVAANDLITEGRERTDSRISIMTGVHRKEIRRLRMKAPDHDRIPATVTLGTQIVAAAAEHRAPDDGRPLPLICGEGHSQSFEALVVSVTTDVRLRAGLADWVSQGLVSTNGADQIHLNTAAFIPRPGADEQIFLRPTCVIILRRLSQMSAPSRERLYGRRRALPSPLIRAPAPARDGCPNRCQPCVAGSQWFGSRSNA